MGLLKLAECSRCLYNSVFKNSLKNAFSNISNLSSYSPCLTKINAKPMSSIHLEVINICRKINFFSWVLIFTIEGSKEHFVDVNSRLDQNPRKSTEISIHKVL